MAGMKKNGSFFHNLITSSLLILKKEDEFGLAYLFGKKLNDFPHLNIKKRNGFFLRFLIFFHYLYVRIGWTNKHSGEKDVFFYAETKNQYDSMRSVFQELNHTKVMFCDKFVEKRIVIDKGSNMYPVIIGLNVLIVVLFLTSIKAPALLFRIVRDGDSRLTRFHFDKFLLPYIYIPYFLSLLHKIKPKLIVMSNDHNPSNRALLATARFLKIKTAYVQHATVSDLFPPLAFDYAFLDGEISHERYLKANEKNFISYPGSKTLIFFTGCQKSFPPPKELTKKCSVGLGINRLDNPSKVMDLVQILGRNNINTIIRPHPHQQESFIKQLGCLVAKYKSVKVDFNRSMTLSNFLSSIDALFASETSLHLEAALMGVQTYYIDLGEQEIKKDYYGFVKEGVARTITKDAVLELVETGEIMPALTPSRMNSISRYSETFGTVWQGSEGALVAKSIEKLLKGHSFNEFIWDREINVYRLPK